MGTITGIGDLDPVRWPNSHWRSVKVFNLTFLLKFFFFTFLLEVQQPHACLFSFSQSYVYSICNLFRFILIQFSLTEIFLLTCTLG